MNIEFSNIAVIAPHPDDETIAMGGTISRLISEGCKVSILVVSGHLPPLYPKESFEVTKKEAEAAFKLMGVSNYEFAKIPATFINQKPIAEINNIINTFLKKCEPDTVFIPFPDRHIDHRVIFDASVVASRPIGDKFPKKVLCYETLSETHWNVPGIESVFNPEFYIDISDFIEVKLDALSLYNSQVKGNYSRSLDACKALALFRGSQNGCKYAEGFKIVRIVL